jgi:hypothetical protein
MTDPLRARCGHSVDQSASRNWQVRLNQPIQTTAFALLSWLILNHPVFTSTGRKVFRFANRMRGEPSTEEISQ